MRVTLRCGYCHDGLEPEDVVYCAACLAPQHADCWDELGRCAVLGCREKSYVTQRGQVERRWPWVLAGLAIVATCFLLSLGERDSHQLPRRGSGPVVPGPAPATRPVHATLSLSLRGYEHTLAGTSGDRVVLEPSAGFVSVYDPHERLVATYQLGESVRAFWLDDMEHIEVRPGERTVVQLLTDGLLLTREPVP